MSNVLKTRSQYLEELEQDLADEFDIATGNSYNLATSAELSVFKDRYFNKESFDDFAKRILSIPDGESKLFTPADENDEKEYLHDREGYSFEWDLDVKRLKTLVEVIQNFLENIDVIRKTDAYKKLKMLIPDHDVTLLALVVEEMKMYAEEMIEILDRNKQYLLSEFAPTVKKMRMLANHIIESKSRLEIVDYAYEMEDLLANYFETLIDRTFEWDQEQINRANWFVNLITDFEANWYFLLLIREEQIIKEGLSNNPYVNSRSGFYEAKQELLSEGNVMREAGIAYNGKVTKNHKK